MLELGGDQGRIRHCLMHTVVYSRAARRGLRQVPRDRVAQIVGSIDELSTIANPATHQNVKRMKGEWDGFHRLRIGSYRAIFSLIADPDAKDQDRLLLITVEAVGSRQSIY